MIRQHASDHHWPHWSRVLLARPGAYWVARRIWSWPRRHAAMEAAAPLFQRTYRKGPSGMGDASRFWRDLIARSAPTPTADRGASEERTILEGWTTRAEILGGGIVEDLVGVERALDAPGYVEIYGPDPGLSSCGGQGWIRLDRGQLEWLRDAALPAAIAALVSSPPVLPDLAVAYTREQCIEDGGHFWPRDQPATCKRCGYNPGWIARPDEDQDQQSN